ncbi:hypothetical protein Q669_28920 [Labrenzia sp. C1B10]|nr:hypothetical protein Q669_28920 [Labrenzia sp. C1B10]ERS06911.1 hypothetical protein Q675_24775 [Labrenzia sp. C1B70]
MVTGIDIGIGKAIAIVLGDAGAHITCAGRSDCAETASHLENA